MVTSLADQRVGSGGRADSKGELPGIRRLGSGTG